ncbi:TetR/AcrR family transcriptional regulator [Roseovarius faecimaris]|uniref:TetR/AcrR family transcriptional regulator n=1 Tax=Roseovarius faecimaris TaxID=2494550 RepID=A0A6I6IU14_9RHOB|nr:TetR/AcrR family transcriptional regulator [Roseovarius faecimaris]QGX99393.1 TetR/AcrR family transcriptional regulator [Roseovarius faecimaris]
MSSLAKPRLTQDTWIDAGLDALAEHGPEALKAEPLARRLGTTKGSFYWHFKDVPDFHRALLGRWEAAAQPALPSGSAVIQLRELAQALATADHSEPAIRAWGRSNAQAKAALKRLDMARLELLEDLLAQVGIGNPEMARILYATALGMRGMESDAPGPDAMGTLVDLVLALR